MDEEEEKIQRYLDDGYNQYEQSHFRHTNEKEDEIKMDYQEELKKVEAGGNFWKPKPGQFKVKSLTEIEPTDPFIRKHEDKEDEVTPQFKLTIVIDGEEKLWTFGKGATPASTYGQLIGLATKRNNTLKDVEFSIVVTNDGTKNNFTIVE